MYTPEFPYKSDQVIISSDRVLLHSKNDAIFLFGKQAVSLSSPKTINLDAYQKVLIDTPIIELGKKAQGLGEPVVLGRSLNTQLIIFLSNLVSVANDLANVSESDIGGSMARIAGAGQKLSQESDRLRTLLLADRILSKTTFTR